jgi:hypothetical protein
MSTSFCATAAYLTRFAALRLKAPDVLAFQGAQAEDILPSRAHAYKDKGENLKELGADTQYGFAKPVYHHLSRLLRGEGRKHCIIIYIWRATGI